MTPETHQEYLRQAEFYLAKVQNRFGKITYRSIKLALLEDAPNWRPKYFTKLRRAIVVHQEHNGFGKYAKQIEKIKHPATDEFNFKADKPAIKKKIPKVKHVRDVDEKKIIDYFRKTKNKECIAAIKIVKELGVRPAEIASIRVEGNVFHITGAKQGKDRGLNRRLEVTDAETANALTQCLQVINESSKTINQIQNNISKTASRIFKGRKTHYCLYSWRHQFGGELKASTMPAKTIAYLMGHQSTASIEDYGFRNRARGGLKVKPNGYDPEIKKIRVKPKSQYLKRNTTLKAQNVNLNNGLQLK